MDWHEIRRDTKLKVLPGHSKMWWLSLSLWGVFWLVFVFLCGFFFFLEFWCFFNLNSANLPSQKQLYPSFPRACGVLLPLLVPCHLPLHFSLASYRHPSSLQTPQEAWLPLVHTLGSKRYPSRLKRTAEFFASPRDEAWFPGWVWYASPRSLSPLGMNIKSWTQA